MSKKKGCMDGRCPRKLKGMPSNYCPLAVMRLKHLRNADKELTEEEEEKAPGCPWAVNHQMSNYCFFSFAENYLDKPLSDMEVAHLNSISTETVKKTEKKALISIKNSDVIKQIGDSHKDGQIIKDTINPDDYYE